MYLLLTYRSLRRVRCASVRIPRPHRANTTTPQSPSRLALRLRTRIGRALRSSLRRVLEIFADYLRLQRHHIGEFHLEHVFVHDLASVDPRQLRDQREHHRAGATARDRALRAHQIAPHALANLRTRTRRQLDRSRLAGFDSLRASDLDSIYCNVIGLHGSSLLLRFSRPGSVSLQYSIGNYSVGRRRLRRRYSQRRRTNKFVRPRRTARSDTHLPAR